MAALLSAPAAAWAGCRTVSGETVVNAAGSPFSLATAGCLQRTAVPTGAPLSPLLQLYEPPRASVDVVLHGRRVRRPAAAAPGRPAERQAERPASATITVPRDRAPPPMPRRVYVRPRTGVVAASAPLRPSAGGLAYAPAIYGVARAYDIDPAFMGAVVRRESGFNPAARSGKGAQGFMQVMPGTAARFGVSRAGLANPMVNLAVGATYLKSLQRRYGNNLPLILAAYNAGEGAVDRHGRRIPPYRETQAYVGGIIGDYGGALRRRTAGR